MDLKTGSDQIKQGRYPSPSRDRATGSTGSHLVLDLQLWLAPRSTDRAYVHDQLGAMAARVVKTNR